MIYTAAAELQCSKCKGTIAPGCMFDLTIVNELVVGTLSQEDRLMRKSVPTYLQQVHVRLCYDCYDDLPVLEET